MDLVMWLLEALLASTPDKQIGSRLAAALAACAQLSALPASQRFVYIFQLFVYIFLLFVYIFIYIFLFNFQRMWSLQSLRRLMMATNHGVSLNIMSESQSSASVTSPVGTTTDVISVASMTLRPLVSDTALSVLVKGM